VTDPPGLSRLNTDLLEIIENCKRKAAEHQKNGVIVFPAQANREDMKPRSMMSRCGVDRKYESCSFANFHGADKLKADLSRLVEGGKSVMITGNTGCGKTHLSVAMLAEYIKGHGDSALFVTLPDLLLEIRASFSDRATRTEKELVDCYSTNQFLVLDDLGAEKPTEFTVATLSLILDRRIRQNRQTVITTNLTLEAIEGYSNARIASRISEMEQIRISMPDYRKRRRVPA